MPTPASRSLADDRRCPAAGCGSRARCWRSANFMVVLDTTIANVSVPHIAGSLGISPDQGTWVITSYSVAEAISVPLTGWLAARFGTVRTFVVGDDGFGIFSILCGMSPTLGMLVSCRIGQGICGGPMMPLTPDLAAARLPAGEARSGDGHVGDDDRRRADRRADARRHDQRQLVVALDLLHQHPDRDRSASIGSLSAASAGARRRRRKRRIDVVGLALLVIWVGALQIMLDIGRDHDWFAFDLHLGAGDHRRVGFVAFLIWELTEEHPVVDLRVFRHRGFSAAVIALALTYGTFFSAVVVTPQWLQSAMGYTAPMVGLRHRVAGLPGGRVLADRRQADRPVRSARSGVVRHDLDGGDDLRARPSGPRASDYWTLALPHLAQGLGMPFFFVPLTILSLGRSLPKETASAAGLSSFVRTLSGAVGTSIATTLWANGAIRVHDELVGSINSNPAIDQPARNRPASALPRCAQMIENLLTQESLVVSLDHMFLIATSLLLASAVLIWLVPKPRKAVDTSQAH